MDRGGGTMKGYRALGRHRILLTVGTNSVSRRQGTGPVNV